MLDDLSADRPVSIEKQDRFQRYPFSKRIAQTIISRKSEECIVIGIYGQWGEGKTSVINFILNELKSEEAVLSMKFNPWTYQKEEELLVQFFTKLAVLLDTGIKNQKERIGEVLRKYGKLFKIDVPFLGNVGEKLEDAGDILAEVDIEQLKQRVSDIIKKSGKKVVIFIDDIDRLDKQEIQAVFRLVKLTADFENVVYVLAFDENMVAAALGDRFGEGNKLAGENFLEKIIQIPLKLPVVQSRAIKDYLLEAIDKALLATQIELTEKEVIRLVNAILKGVLPVLKTPRLAIRYGNTISFSLPLLYQEANTVDLLLIEALKIFHPPYYNLIKMYPDHFVGSSNNKWTANNAGRKPADVIKEAIQEARNGLTDYQFNGVKDLLMDLFPKVNSMYSNYHWNNETELYQAKRIAAAKYFNRYFSYAVIKGEIPDIAFDALLEEVEMSTEGETLERIRRLMDEGNAEDFLLKLRTKEDLLPWGQASKLSEMISKNDDLFPETSNASFSYGTPKTQAAIFIAKVLKNNSDSGTRFELAKQLIQISRSIDFAIELERQFVSEKTGDVPLFTDLQNTAIKLTLVKKALAESGYLPLWEKFRKQAYILLFRWNEVKNDQVKKYVKREIKKKKGAMIDVLQALTPIIKSSAYKESYQSNFDEQEFQFMTSIVDVELIITQLNQTYTKKELAEDIKILWEEHAGPYQTPINIARQFLHWYRKFKAKNNDIL